MSGQHEDTAVERVASDYAATKRQLDTLMDEARNVGARFERLGHALFAHPMRTIIGTERPVSEDRREWDMVPDDPLPTIETLAALTDDIRETTRRTHVLRERLILMGRADLVQQRDEFFK